MSSIFVVVAPSSSVGTARLKTWPVFERTTGGLTCAWADALAATTSAGSGGGQPDGDEPPPRAMAVHSMDLLSQVVYRPAAGNGPTVHLGGARERSDERAAVATQRRPWSKAGSSGGEPAGSEASSRASVRPSQREHVPARGDDGRGEEREREQDRHGVGVRGPDEAVQPVPAEARAPVDRRLEEREGEAGRDPERERADGEPHEPQPRALEHRPGLEQPALADRERRERDHRSADREREPERDSGHDEQPGPAGLPLELDGEWARRELVDDPAGREHDERADGEPERTRCGRWSSCDP